MSTEYPTLLHRWFDQVWNQKNSFAINEMMSEEAVIHGLSGPGAPPIRGASAFEKYHSSLLAAFPDIRVDVEDVISEGDKIAGRFTVTGTQSGDLPDIAATGKKVLFTGSGIASTENGKFVEVWNEVDFPKMHYDLAPDTPDVE
jgi:predicted ester cyclase